MWLSCRLLVSWRALVPEFLPAEQVSWKCAAQRREAGGTWLAAGDLYLTQHRLIWQPPRWTQSHRRVTASYPLSDCVSFGRGDLRPMGRYPSWGSNAWKRMRLGLATGETVELAVRRPEKAAMAISAAIDAARRPDP